MDLKAFLSGGTSYVHSPEGKGSLLAKVGGALILSLAASVGVSDALAQQRASTIAEVQRPTDVLSEFYQNLAAPGDRHTLVVSTKSPDYQQLVQSIPKPFYQYLNSKANGDGSFAFNRYFDFRGLGYAPSDAFALTMNRTDLFDRMAGRQGEKLCFINSAEATLEIAEKTREGREYARLPTELPFAMTAEDSLFHVTTHELYHCPGADIRYSFDLPSDAPRGLKLYATAVDEAMADLAAILHYASKEGTFADGLAVHSGLRSSSFNAVDHYSEDMVKHILEGMNPEDFKGKSSVEINQIVNQISKDLDPMNNQNLKDIYAHTVVEKIALYSRVFGPNMMLDIMSTEVNNALKSNPQDVNVERRALRVIDDLITHRVRSKELHRELGDDNMALFKHLANASGVELPVYQQARIATFDAQFSPPGSPHQSPLERDHDLVVLDHFNPLLTAYVEGRENAIARNAPAPAAAPEARGEVSTLTGASGGVSHLSSDFSQWTILSTSEIKGAPGAAKLAADDYRVAPAAPVEPYLPPEEQGPRF